VSNTHQLGTEVVQTVNWTVFGGVRANVEPMTVTASGRPDLACYAQAMRLDTAVLVTGLREVLGARLVAYLGGVRETRAVRQWAEGIRGVQDPADERRLRLAYRVAGLLSVREPAGVVQAWFQGLNPQLGDRAPVRVLREDDLDDAGPLVLAAARSFAATG